MRKTLNYLFFLTVTTCFCGLTADTALANFWTSTFVIKGNGSDIPATCNGDTDLCSLFMTKLANDDKIMVQRPIKGYIVKIDLSDPAVALVVSKRIESKECMQDTKMLRYYNSCGIISHPVKLTTTIEWARKLDLDYAFNASFFKFTEGKGVRDNPACGEYSGVSINNGYMQWPRIVTSDLLHENIDNDVKYPSSVLSFDKTLKPSLILQPTKREAFADTAYGISGSAMFHTQKKLMVLNNVGTKSNSPMARLGVGLLGGYRIFILMVEGHKEKNSIYGKGLRINSFSRLMRGFGAQAGINLDGSGSASFYRKAGLPTVKTDHTESTQKIVQTSFPSDIEGTRPVANHFGFKIVKQRSAIKTWGDNMETAPSSDKKED